MEDYLLSHHKTDILQILQDTDYKKHYPVNINFVELFEYDTNVGNNILKNPDKALEELDEWITCAQNIFIQQVENSSLSAKLSLHARVYGLPACPQLHRNIFPKNEDLNLFLQITGTVVRVTAAKMLEYRRPYICTKCKQGTVVDAVYDQKYIIIPPKKCSNAAEGCPGKNFINSGDLKADNCKDYQEVKIQEQASKLGIGSMPSSMWVTLEDDLVDSCKPGDDVTICGIVKRRWGSLVPGKRIDVELVLKANHIQVNNGQTSPSLITPEVKQQFCTFWEKYKSKPLEGRDLILKSFCPKLYGMYIVKLAVAVVLAGGTHSVRGNEAGIQLYGMYIVKLAVAVVLAGGTHSVRGNEAGIQVRSESHILLVGDPGTGKSQLLRYAAKIIPRSVLTTGVGTTSAGLTVAAIMEDGQWQLEGGALVLADGGICCIDEFNSMKPHDRASIHEAMEQQTISVAKASMVCKLRTRCSILAATNPKGGHLDPSQPLSLNLALPSPLLSRFDVVLMLSDTYDNEWDNLVADYILSGKGMGPAKTDASFWNLEMLQQYFTIIRSLNPALTPSTNKLLSTYYQAQRRATFRNKARTTVRLLDSLVRLSQAHARLMFHEEVHVMDALFAVVLIENSMHGECAVLSLDKVNVQAPFSAAPMESYAQLAVTVLGKLGLQEILKNELLSLSDGYAYNSSISNSENVSISQISVELNGSKPNVISEITTVQDTFDNMNDNASFIQTDVKEIMQSVHFVNNDAKLKKGIENICDSTPNKQILKEKSGNEGKKRKRLKSEEQKQTKNAKNNSELNDFQMLNLIRSANDDFDMEILNFTSEDDNQLPLQIQNNSDFLTEVAENAILSQTTKLKKEIREKFTFKPRQQPHLQLDKKISEKVVETNSTDQQIDSILNSKDSSKSTDTEEDTSRISQSVEVQKKNRFYVNTNEENDGSIFANSVSTSNKNRSSLSSLTLDTHQEAKSTLQNKKFEKFYKMFAFKPGDHSRSDKEYKQKENNLEGKDHISGHDKSVNSNLNKSHLQISQSLFKSQDEDYDSLDF